MSKVAITDTYLTNIANAIRSKSESSDTYTPSEMASAILNIPSGGTEGVYKVSSVAEMNAIENPQTNDFCIIYDETLGNVKLYKYDGTKWVAQISGIVPDEYTQVQYLQGTGTQFIDTGYRPYKTKTEMQFQQPTSSSVSQYVGGSRGTGDVRYYLTVSNGSTKKFVTCGRAGDDWTELSSYNAYIHTVVYNDENNKVKFDGTIKMTISDLPSQNVDSLYLFALNSNGTALEKFTGRIYYCRMTDKNTNELVRYLVPCVRKSDSVAGMYDLVEGVFYTNAGTGTFLYG